MNPPALEHPNYQIPFVPLYVKRKGSPWGYSPQNTGTTIDPCSIIANKWALGHEDNHLTLEPLHPLPFWLRPQRKSLCDPLLTILKTHQ